MGLWIKNADGTIERTAGGGADGQPGVDGEDGQPGADGNMWHVGSGAPASTLGEPGDYYLDGTDGWVYVKRNDSSWTNLYVNLTGPPGSGGGGDFLPLSGGTVTGDLQVDGTIRANKTGSKGNPSINLGATGTGMYAAYLDTDGGKIRTTVNSNIVLEAEHDKVSVLTDLGVAGDLQVDGTITGTLAFGIADGINTRDVLDRAETATMPAFDAEGVATTDVDGLTVNEVVTALLAKVKELSARIETLEGQTRLIR